MADYTDDDVTRLAEMLPLITERRQIIARILLEQGVTLPPPPSDPAVVVAVAMSDAWADDESTQSVLRDLFPTDALEAAAAKAQEARS